MPIVCKNTLTVWTAALSFLLHVLAAEYAVMGMLAYQGRGCLKLLLPSEVLGSD